MKPNAKIAMLGAGAWGTAVANVVAGNGYQVHLWCREPEVAQSIQATSINERFLPGVTLSKNIIPSTSLQDVVAGAQIIFEAIPVAFLRTIVKQCQPFLSSDATWVLLSKGIEQDSLLLPTDIIDDVFGKRQKTIVLSGPSFAKELVEQQFTAVTLAGFDANVLRALGNIMNNDYFHTQSFDDPIAVQVGGALKNVCALAVGIVQGNGGKSNTAAYVLTKGLQELCVIAKCLGGKSEGLYELAGVGDLILTCTGTLSKNLQAGKLLAQNRDIQQLEKHFAAIPEGINTLKSVHQIMNKHELHLPLFSAVYDYIINNGPFEALLQH